MSDLESLGLPVDPADFYGVADAIAQVLREARDDPPDEALLSAKAHRRLRMALTAYLTDSTDALRTQLAEAQKDAQRYRFITRTPGWAVDRLSEGGVGYVYRGDNIDAAIDAALSHPETRQPEAVQTEQAVREIAARAALSAWEVAPGMPHPVALMVCSQIRGLANEAVQPVAWQPIETVKPPEDTPVWLWSAEDGVWIGTFSYPDADGWCFTKCYRVPYFIDGKWQDDDAEWDDDYAPTLWMPLPAPPAAAQGGQPGEGNG